MRVMATRLPDIYLLATDGDRNTHHLVNNGLLARQANRRL